MANKRPDTDRGRVETIELSKVIIFNGKRITKVIIEIDHINHGLNDDKSGLKVAKRTDFSARTSKNSFIFSMGNILRLKIIRAKFLNLVSRLIVLLKADFTGSYL